jgi:hypothetical protein
MNYLVFLNNLSYFYRAVVWAGRVGISFTTDSARLLHKKYLFRRHFLKSDFTTAERVHLNRVAFPCGSDSAPQHFHNLLSLHYIPLP